jgi:hypothetical protein
MSGTQTSAFPDQNTLLSSLSGGLTASVQRNQLLNEQGRQQIGAADLDYASRLAQGVLGITDPSQRAAAYTDGIQRLQAAGFAKNSPLQYPGDAAMQHVANLAIPVAQQYELGLVNPAGLSDAIDRITRGGSASVPASGGGNDNNFGNIRPNGASSGFNSYATPQEGIAAMSQNLAAYASQHGINTLNGLTSRWAPKGDGNNDPVAYAKTLGAKLGIDPNAPINLGDPMLQSRLIPAMAAVEKGRPFNQPSDVLTAGIQAGLGGSGGGVAARYPGAVQAAGPGAGLPTAATDPGTADLDGPRPLPPVGPGSPTPPTPQVLANTPAPVAGAPVQTAAALPPAAASPQAPAMPPTGVNSPQFLQATELQRQAAEIASYPGAAHSPLAQARIKELTARAALLMQADSVTQVPGVGQVHSLTGAVDKPVPHYVDDGHGGLVDATGSTLPPTPRGITTLSGNTYMLLPGGGKKLVEGADPDAIAARHQAETTGSAVGKDVVQQTQDFTNMQKDSANAINQIDMGLGHLTTAMQGNAQPGKFAGFKNAINAAATGLGINPASWIPLIGQTPEAVTDIQVAKKSLAIVSGAIIRQAIGGTNPELTDAKLQGFIDARPGIENDPRAIFRIMNWARGQVVFQNEMANAAMDAASQTPTGTVPATFRARYLAQHGGGPTYNTETGATEQPDGQRPARDSPYPDIPSNAPQKSQYVEGQTATGPGGKKAIYRNGAWTVQ